MDLVNDSSSVTLPLMVLVLDPDMECVVESTGLCDKVYDSDSVRTV